MQFLMGLYNLIRRKRIIPDACSAFMVKQRIAHKRRRETAVLFFVALAIVFSGCAPAKFELKKRFPPDLIRLPIGMPEAEAREHAEVLKDVAARNAEIERDPEWILDAYDRFMIRNLRNVSSSDYAGYGRYLDDGAVYIIVHPAYTTFFNVPKKHLDQVDDFDIVPRNAVERLLSKPVNTARMALVQAQERQIRDFLELKSTERKLIIIIIETAYMKNRQYRYKDSTDEYMRFIDEATNESESVLYIESKRGGGSLAEDDSVRLAEFLAAVGPTRILLGGSYVGRCLEGFYNSFTELYGESNVFVVPELSAISPNDLAQDTARQLLDQEGNVNAALSAEFIKKNVDRPDKVPAIFHLGRKNTKK